jgi:hypothetical protein
LINENNIENKILYFIKLNSKGKFNRCSKSEYNQTPLEYLPLISFTLPLRSHIILTLLSELLNYFSHACANAILQQKQFF